MAQQLNPKRVNLLIRDLLFYIQTLDKRKYVQWFVASISLLIANLIAEGCNVPSPLTIYIDHCPVKRSVLIRKQLSKIDIERSFLLRLR